MTFSKPITPFVIVAVLALTLSLPVGVAGQVLERLPNIYPMNELPNPYVSEDWGEPARRKDLGIHGWRRYRSRRSAHLGDRPLRRQLLR